MYAQFFGNYLLNNNAVTPEQLTAAIGTMGHTHMKIGTMAMHKGYMTAAEVDEVCFLQTREDKRFGEIAIERNYLFEDQLEELLKSQSPDYLLLGQALVDAGALTNNELEALIVEYQDESEIDDVSVIKGIDQTSQLIENFLLAAERPVDQDTITYLKLMFNSLVRFIGDDFTPLSPVTASEYNPNCFISQKITGPITCVSSIDMEEDVAISFASRYAKMDFTEFDEYVQASLEDFLNLHNGLFTVNMSANVSMELTLEPPLHVTDPVVEMDESTLIIPIIYTFGTIYIFLTL